MRKLRRILGDSKGEGFPLTAAVTISLMLIFLAVMQYARLMITAAGVRDAMQEAVLSAVNDNYADVYHAVREGYAAGYQPYGGGFVESYQYHAYDISLIHYSVRDAEYPVSCLRKG